MTNKKNSEVVNEISSRIEKKLNYVSRLREQSQGGLKSACMYGEDCVTELTKDVKMEY